MCGGRGLFNDQSGPGFRVWYSDASGEERSLTAINRAEVNGIKQAIEATPGETLLRVETE